MAFVIEDSEHFSTWQTFVSHLRLECCSLLAKDAQAFSVLDKAPLIRPGRPVKNSADVTELLEALSENVHLSPGERCPHA